MSKLIRISDSIFERLQQLAEPLVDTPAGVIQRVLDHYDSTGQLPSGRRNASNEFGAISNFQNILLRAQPENEALL